MIIRQHATSWASYSDCNRYRPVLMRQWNPDVPRVVFIMLNPSTATELRNDPTVERCERRARALGYGALRVVNLFAFRATDPKVMRAQADPIGPGNDQAILDSAGWADLIICGWGTHGAHLQRGPDVARELRLAGHPLFHLGLTQAGHPKHPLYIGYDRQPILWA